MARFSFKSISAVALATLLAACGGGGGGGAGGAANTGSGNANGESPAAQALAKYEGSWYAGCSPIGVVDANGNVPNPIGSERYLVTFSAPNAQGVYPAKYDLQFYLPGDCTGNPVATLGEPVGTYSLNGTKTLATGEVVDLVDINLPTGNFTISGPNASFGKDPSGQDAILIKLGSSTLLYELADTTSFSGKTIAALSADGNRLLIGADGTDDASGYPTALDPIELAFVRK
jgi:hypothetical protein